MHRAVIQNQNIANTSCVLVVQYERPPAISHESLAGLNLDGTLSCQIQGVFNQIHKSQYSILFEFKPAVS